MAIKNLLKYSLSQKLEQTDVLENIFKQCPPQLLNATFNLIIINMKNKMDPQQQKQEQKERNQDDNSNSDSDDQEDSQQDDEMEGFLVDSDQDQDEDQGFYHRHPYRDDDDDYEDDLKKNKKKKKEHGKEKTFHKIRKMNRENDFDEGDVQLIEENQRKSKKLNRLKKNKKQKEQKFDYQSQSKENWEDEGDDYGEDQNIDEDSDDFNRQFQGPQVDYDEQSQELMNEIIYDDKKLEDIFEPGDLARFHLEQQQRDIVDMDLPQRQIIQLKNYSKISGKPLEAIRKDFQNQDRTNQAKWIFEKLRYNGQLQSNQQRICRQKILKVLEFLHKEHLEIMYIYYYRKKAYSDILTLDMLWKIYQLDEEWTSFKQTHQKLKYTMSSVLQSIDQVPRELQESLAYCTDSRMLKYFKQYQQFVMSKVRQSQGGKNRSNKQQLIFQIKKKGVDQWLKKNGIFLRPNQLCKNLKLKIQDKRPYTPSSNIKQEFEKFFKNTEEQNDRIRYPLLTPEQRVTSICIYLELELFNYPELRKILKDKYYKKLVISTTPTKKGEQDINLYSMYFPVKRIREKPVNTLKPQVWIMATQAQKLGLITINLKFEWELASGENKNFEGDAIYLELVKYYFDIGVQSNSEVWNMFRKQVLVKMLENLFFPAFMKEVKEDLTRQGHKEIISICCRKFKAQLNRGPSTQQGKPSKILAMVLQNQKLGMAFLDENGQDHSPALLNLFNDEDLKRFVNDQMLDSYILDNKPNLILISANCRKAQTLRKLLRQKFASSSIFATYGQYQTPSLVAKKKIIKGITEERAVLQAISMGRMKQNPLAQILTLWSEKIDENGILEINFHPLQKVIDQHALKDALEKVAIEVVNLVGLDINLIKSHEHYQSQLQFISGLGPKKAFEFIQLMSKKKGQFYRRKQIELLLSEGSIVYKNCSPFFKVETTQHKIYLDRQSRQKFKMRKKGSKQEDEQINLFDMTRIPQQWQVQAQKMMMQAIGNVNLIVIKQKKQFSGVRDEVLATIDSFKHPEKLRGVQIDKRAQQIKSIYFDDELVKSEIMNRFKNPRDPQKAMENKETFYNLLRETPQTLKKFMIFTVKIVSVTQQYLNVVISENGLFGYIRLHNERKKFQKGDLIKALIVGFPFDEKKHRDYGSQDQQQLLKVEMALNFPHFPHKSDDRQHDCFISCFPQIVRSIHPLIDLDRDRFELRKDDRPIIQVKQQLLPRIRTQYRRISHPKFKNVNSTAAIQLMKSQPIGQFVIRPSSQGSDFLVITWNFYKNVINHVKIKTEQKTSANPNMIYRIIDRQRDKVFSTLDEIIDKYIKPMNALVQDVISNKKFLAMNLEQIQEKVKTDTNRDSSHIHYYFGAHEEYPQHFILVYIYKEKRPTKELIKVRPSGFGFHDETFPNIRQLIAWFKEHLRDRDYQRFAKSNAIKR